MKTLRKLSVLTIGLFCLLLFAVVVGAAQLGDEASRRGVSVTTNDFSNDARQTAHPTMVPPVSSGHTWVEIAFSCAVLLFGLILVGVQSFLTMKGKLSESAAFKLIGLTVVVTAGLFVIPAGYSQNQMTPLMGLLGAIAGYLLGKDNQTTKSGS